MRIKFLSIIASLFMVSSLTTSCLDDDTNVEYSPDATIHAFELDTIGYGKSYNFTIDQVNGLIYNEDSLPVRADTIVDRILIKTLTVASGIVFIRDKNGNDSLLNINDSISLDKYINPTAKDKHLELKVFAPDMQTYKLYYLGLRKHKHDPDSLSWKYAASNQLPTGTAQKSVLVNEQIITYAVANGVLTAYKTSTTNAASSTTTAVIGQIFNGQLPSSIVAYNDVLYATSSTKDGKVYQSTDGVNWTESSLFGTDHVEMLLAPLNDRITYIKAEIKVDSNKKYFTSTAKISARAVSSLQEVPENFPTKNISYALYQTKTDIGAVMLIGEYETGKQPTVGTDKTGTIEPWAYMEDDSWVPMSPNNADTSCPVIENPTLIYYNNQFYIFGNGFETFYTSFAGIAWKKADAKFTFPHYKGWDKTPSYSPETTPEFRGRMNYSAVVDEKANIWMLFSAGEATFTETVEKTEKARATEEKTRTYSYPSETWKGRLNQLWFDIANGKYTTK